MATTKEYTLLHNADYVYRLKNLETKCIIFVYNYVAHNKDISLQKAADLLNMTPTSFSRYFRIKPANLFEFVREIRDKTCLQTAVGK